MAKNASVCRECKKVVRGLAIDLILAGVAVPVLADVFEGHVSRRWLYNKRKEHVHGDGR